jgi:hypothetical protein
VSAKHRWAGSAGATEVSYLVRRRLTAVQLALESPSNAVVDKGLATSVSRDKDRAVGCEARAVDKLCVVLDHSNTLERDVLKEAHLSVLSRRHQAVPATQADAI